jgi:hypothetical protein
MIRRNHKGGELAHFQCWMPRPVPLATLVRAAGRRWTIEERLQTGKGLVGLDQHQVRRWRSWYRWVTLAMLAYAFLAVAAAIERAQHPAPPGLIELSCNEVAHLFAVLVIEAATDQRTGCAGRCGDDDIKHAPAEPTTSDKPPSSHEHDEVRLGLRRDKTLSNRD